MEHTKNRVQNVYRVLWGTRLNTIITVIPLMHSREIVPQSLLNTVKHRTMVIIKLKDCTTHYLPLSMNDANLLKLKRIDTLKTGN